MGERKILFTDLDGTLLSDDKTISEKNVKAVKEALNPCINTACDIIKSFILAGVNITMNQYNKK